MCIKGYVLSGEIALRNSHYYSSMMKMKKNENENA